jgi:pimeloyl-ACP methyl ester carboxylesterase
MSKDVAFVIAVSGGGVTLHELLLYQVGNRMRRRGFAEEYVQAHARALNQLDAYLRTGEDSAGLAATLAKAARTDWGRHYLSRPVPTAGEREIWRRSGHLSTRRARSWEGVTVPVLAIWGEKDMFVPVEPSVRHITAALRRAKNEDVTVHIFPGADHGLMVSGGPQPDGSFRFGRLAPGYLDTLIAWTRRKTRED